MVIHKLPSLKVREKGQQRKIIKITWGGGVKGSEKDCTVFPSEFRIFSKYGAPAAKISRHSHYKTYPPLTSKQVLQKQSVKAEPRHI